MAMEYIYLNSNAIIENLNSKISLSASIYTIIILYRCVPLILVVLQVINIHLSASVLIIPRLAILHLF